MSASHAPPSNVVSAAIKQLRPKQWTKNAFLFGALVFSGEFLNPDSIVRVLLGFTAFCLVASSGYIVNDALDREADRKHPKKKFRPIASGVLPMPVAMAELVLVLGAGLSIAWWLNPSFFVVTLLYLTTTLTYSFYFKHIVIFDVMFLALGFVWRVVAGALAITVPVSPWLFLCTAFLALFLGFNKRRAELVKLGDKAGTRKILQEYNSTILEEFQSITTSTTVLSYALYAVLGPTPWMALTIPFVLYGIFRYIYLVEKKGEGGAPDETLLKDRPLQVTVILYGLTAVGVLVAENQGWFEAVSLWPKV